MKALFRYATRPGLEITGSLLEASVEVVPAE
jgi:hypothetical protein